MTWASHWDKDFGKHGVFAGRAAHSQGGPGVQPFAFGHGQHDLAPNIWSFGVSISANPGLCTRSRILLRKTRRNLR